MRATRASLLARAGSAAAVAVLAGGGVVATAAAADAATHHHSLQPTTLSIRNKPIAHARHHADMVTGVLRTSHRKDVAGETITLDSRAGHHRRWTVVGTATTGTNGSVSFTVAPTVRTEYKLVFAGDSTYRKSHSNVISLKVAKG